MGIRVAAMWRRDSANYFACRSSSVASPCLEYRRPPCQRPHVRAREPIRHLLHHCTPLSCATCCGVFSLPRRFVPGESLRIHASQGRMCNRQRTNLSAQRGSPSWWTPLVGPAIGGVCVLLARCSCRQRAPWRCQTTSPSSPWPEGVSVWRRWLSEGPSAFAHSPPRGLRRHRVSHAGDAAVHAVVAEVAWAARAARAEAAAAAARRRSRRCFLAAAAPARADIEAKPCAFA